MRRTFKTTRTDIYSQVFSAKNDALNNHPKAHCSHADLADRESSGHVPSDDIRDLPSRVALCTEKYVSRDEFRKRLSDRMVFIRGYQEPFPNRGAW